MKIKIEVMGLNSWLQARGLGPQHLAARRGSMSIVLSQGKASSLKYWNKLASHLEEGLSSGSRLGSGYLFQPHLGPDSQFFFYMSCLPYLSTMLNL